MTERATFSVTDYGAETQSEHVQTKQFQAALNACRDNNGGTVVVPAGQFHIGSIRLYSNTRLLLKSGAVIKGSENLGDYQTFGEEPGIRYLHDDYFVKAWHLPPYYFHAIIAAYDAENITIEAEAGAIIDGQDVFDPDGEESFRGPMGMVFARVNQLQLKNYTIKNTANWSHVIAGCTDVRATDVTILAGHDGFNLHHSNRIEIKNCVIKSGDDCLAGYDVANLSVHDTVLNTACNNMRIGGTNILIDRCLFTGPGEYPHRSENTFFTHAMFKWYAADADTIKADGTNIQIENSIMYDAQKLLTYDFNNKEIMQNGRPLRELSLIGNVIGKIKETSKFLGNGEPVKLRIEGCRITPPDNQPLLMIDDMVELIFDNVTFTTPTVIARKGRAEVPVSGYITHEVI